MEIMKGRTIEDLAREEIDICFTFVPRGTKKTIEQIFIERNTSPYLKKIMQKEAEEMVDCRFLFYDKNKKAYVFSKDKEGKYSWQPATRKDILINYISRFFYI